VFVTVACDEKGDIVTGSIPLNYYLQAPWEDNFKANYEKYAALDARLN